MSEKGKRIELKPLNLPEIDKDRVNEDNFLADLVITGNELRRLLAICAAQLPQVSTESKHYAVLMGLMVRLFKLFDTFLLLTCEQRLEPSMIIARSVTDTAIDLIFLCKKNDTSLIDEFIKTSLATDKEIYKLMLIDEANGVGDEVIRNRIKSSIENTFNSVNISLEEINSSNWQRKHNTRERSKLCGIENLYLLIFKNLSRITHGSWSEILMYHLEKDEESWSPNLNFAIPRPQLINSLPILVAIAGIEYTDCLTENHELTDQLKQVIEWYRNITEEHEYFLRN